jgi:hypothetical protein
MTAPISTHNVYSHQELLPLPLQHHPQVIWLPQHHVRVTWTQLQPDPEPSPVLRSSRNRTFHLFPQLPLELQFRIWSFASPPRVIELRSWGDRTRNSYVPIKFSAARHPFPVILHVNQTSRREGLRWYKKVNLGVSTTIIDPNKQYVAWEIHPYNPNAIVRYESSRFYFPLAIPYRPQQLYVNFSQDIIYLGPEFKHQHLQDFLTATGPGIELASVQHLAIDRKSWVSGGRQFRGTGFEYLRRALYSLSHRPLKTLYIVPDDEPNNLANRFHYHKHKVTLVTPPFKYMFQPEGQTEFSRTVVENLEEWMERLWIGREIPKVEIKSVRRDGERMVPWKSGMWEIQRLLGDMVAWKTWVPDTTY